MKSSTPSTPCKTKKSLPDTLQHLHLGRDSTSRRNKNSPLEKSAEILLWLVIQLQSLDLYALGDGRVISKGF